MKHDSSKKECLIELYPLLKCSIPESRDIKLILNNHGYPANRLRKWFKSIPSCIDWIESNVSEERLENAIDLFSEKQKKKEEEESIEQNMVNHESFFESDFVNDWLLVIDNVRYDDVRSHFFSDVVH